MKRGLALTCAVVALASVASLWRAVSLAGGAIRPVTPANVALERGFPFAAEAALGRRVLVLLADPAKPRTGEILESGRAAEGWVLFPGAPPGSADLQAALDALAARAAAAFDRQRDFPDDVAQALALFAVKAVLVDDGGKGAEPLRTLARAEPVLRLDAETAPGTSGDVGDPVALAASLRTSLPRESAGWTASDWEDAMWGGAVTIETSEPARFVFPYPAAGAHVTVNDARVDVSAAPAPEAERAPPAASQAGPLLVLDLPAGRSRVDVRFVEPGPGETFAVLGAAGFVLALLTFIVSLRPSRAEIEAAAARAESPAT